jgi:hypothetical protein
VIAIHVYASNNFINLLPIFRSVLSSLVRFLAYCRQYVGTRVVDVKFFGEIVSRAQFFVGENPLHAFLAISVHLS